MKKNCLVLLGLSVWSFGSGQQVLPVKNAWAFVKISAPGNVMVDEGGNEVRRMIVKRTIYLETPYVATLTIEKIIAGSTFNGSVEKLNVQREIAGMRMDKQIIINVQRNHSLWKIDVTPVTTNKVKSLEKPLANIQITGRINGKKFLKTIKKEVQLSGDIHP